MYYQKYILFCFVISKVASIFASSIHFNTGKYEVQCIILSGWEKRRDVPAH